MLTVRFQDGQLIKTFENIPDYLLERRSSKLLALLQRLELSSDQRSDVRELVMVAIDEANICTPLSIDQLQERMVTGAPSDYDRVLDTVRQINRHLPDNNKDFMDQVMKTVCNIYYHTQTGELKPSFINRHQDAINELYHMRMFVFNAPPRRRRSEYEVRYHIVVDNDTNHYGMSVNRGYNLRRDETVLNLFTAYARAKKYKHVLPMKLPEDSGRALNELIVFLGWPCVN